MRHGRIFAMEFFNNSESLEKQPTSGTGLKLDNRRTGALTDLSRGRDPGLVGLVRFQISHFVMQVLRRQNILGDLHLLTLI